MIGGMHSATSRLTDDSFDESFDDSFDDSNDDMDGTTPTAGGQVADR